MGLFRKMLKNAIDSKTAAPPKYDPQNPPTRWEKAVVGLNGIVAQVSKIDPDGVDVVAFGDDFAPEWHRNVKDLKGLEALVTSKEPSGVCNMGSAMEDVLNEALERGFDKRPCSILVLTAGRPDDHDELDRVISTAAAKVKKASDLSITFVQVGDDEQAEQYLKHLDDELTTTNGDGESIDLVDTIKDEEIKKAVGDYKKSGGKAAAGALFGAFAGAAMGAGGVYLHNKISAKQRTAGWNGTWKALNEDGEEVATLTVKDDMAGNLTVQGWPEEATSTGSYAENDEGGFNIQHDNPMDDTEAVSGTIEDEHHISWSDGTRWNEVEPEGVHWTKYAGAAAAGAAAAGTTGALMQKKFFNKASKGVESDYIIVLDRSAKMAIPDTGK